MILLAIFIVLLGAVMGSFACCQMWRLRYQQEGKKPLGKWSVCLSCGKRLTWQENIPIISWLALRGRCKKCGEKIGSAEIISEMSLAAIYGLILWYFWGGVQSGELLAIAKLATMLILMVPMWVVLLYDARWGEMPTKLLYLCIILAGVYRLLAGGDFLSTLGGVGILAGTYLVLYAGSREKLVGAGDWLLCLSIALVLGNWWLSLLTLFVANLLGSIIMLPFAVRKKKHQIHLAPFLISAFLLVFLAQEFFLQLIRL